MFSFIYNKQTVVSSHLTLGKKAIKRLFPKMSNYFFKVKILCLFIFLIINYQSCAELPPPPAPLHTDDSLQLLADVLSRSRADKEGSDSPTLQKRGEHFSPERRGSTKWLSQGKHIMQHPGASFSKKIKEQHLSLHRMPPSFNSWTSTDMY